MSTKLDALISFAVKGSEGERGKARKWNSEDDNFLKTNLGYMTEEEMGKALGRTATAVRLRWKRDLQLVSPSKAPNVITAHKAARMIGVDSHKITHWVDQKFIPGRQMAGGRKIRLIDRDAFLKWVLEPMNWMYFDLRSVKDLELKKLLRRKSKQWGDEWWPTPKVARYHNVKTGDVKRYIKLKRIRARQIEFSYGGRHPDLAWKLWFVLKSEATRPDLKFIVRRYKPKGKVK